MGTSRRSRTLGVLLLVSLAAATVVATAPTAQAETADLPVTVTANPTTNLVDGSVISINVNAQSPPNATPSSIFGVEARLCEADAVIDFSADFNPTQTGKCVLDSLSAGTDAKTSVAIAPPYNTAALDFKVGVGTDTYERQDGEDISISCGPGNPCKLVVKLQVPNSVDFKSFPLYYVGDTPPGDLFTGITPKRILDSRPGFQVGPYSTPWTANATREVTVAGGTTTVPADADAVTLNVTVTQTNAVSYLTLWPKGDSKPTASSLNWDPGWTVPNSVTVKVGTGGVINVFNNLGSANVIIDVVGYYKANTGAGFTSLQPKRILDSRPAFQVGPYSTPWTATTDRLVTVAGGTTTVPADADSVVLNVTVTQTNAVSYLSIWPNGQTQPTVSSLNWDSGWTIPNAVTVKVGTGGQIHLYNNLGVANVIVDVVGYFKTGTGSAFHPQSPIRILDSRPAFQIGPFNTPWTATTIRNLDVTSGSVSDSADAVLLNVTVTQTNAVSYLSGWPNGQTQPTVSSLNWASGWTIPNAVTAKVGTGGAIRLYNNLGVVDVIADVAGWYG